MGANVWFWLVFVFIGVFGAWSMSPWRGPATPWGFFGGYVVCLVLIGILGFHAFGSPIR